MTRRDLVWISDITGNQAGAIRGGLVELWRDQRQDQTDTLGLTVSAQHPKADLLVEDAELRYRDARYRVATVIDERKGTEVYRTVEAAGLWIELGDSDVPGTTVIDANPATGLTQILDGSAWTVGDRTATAGGTSALEETDETRLSMLRTWANITGLSLVFDTLNRTVDLVETRGRDLGLAYRYRRNVRGHTRRRQPPEATVILPYGADDLTIAGVNSGNPEVSDYTFYTSRGMTLADAKTKKTRRKVWVDRSFVRDTDLLAAATRRLTELSAERIEYVLDVIDESDIDGNRDDVKLSDRVRVADPDFALDVRATVVRILTDELDPTNNQIELATLPNPLGTGNDTSRPRVGEVWEQFVGRIAGAYEIRNDGIFTVAQIPLRFRTGGRANVHANVKLVGVGGSGIAYLTAYDATTGLALHRSNDIAYTNGVASFGNISFALEDIEGTHALRLRVTTLATGGPSATLGVNIAADPDTVASFYVMAQGAVKERPTTTTSQIFEYTGAIQTFTVPDNVETITVTAKGAKGAVASGGAGGLVEATFPATPGTTYNIYVGGVGTNPAGGWPNGGLGGVANNQGAGGGAASYVILPANDVGGGIVTGSLIVAGGGGGQGDGFFGVPVGGAGGYLSGGNGTHGNGGTQSAGGTSTGGEAGDTEGQGHGGDGPNSGAAAIAEGGGGGGGWHGGGSAGNGSNGGSGGGGSGYIDPSGTDLYVEDGTNSGHGQIVVAWDEPLPNI